MAKKSDKSFDLYKYKIDDLIKKYSIIENTTVLLNKLNTEVLEIE